LGGCEEVRRAERNPGYNERFGWAVGMSDRVLALLVAGTVAVGYWLWRSSKRRKAETVLALMFAENERMRATLKAAASRQGLSITEDDDHIWQTGYFLMSEEERMQFKWMARQMLHGGWGAALDTYPEASEAYHSLIRYLRSHGLRPSDCPKSF